MTDLSSGTRHARGSTEKKSISKELYTQWKYLPIKKGQYSFQQNLFTIIKTKFIPEKAVLQEMLREAL